MLELFRISKNAHIMQTFQKNDIRDYSFFNYPNCSKPWIYSFSLHAIHLFEYTIHLFGINVRHSKYTRMSYSTTSKCSTKKLNITILSYPMQHLTIQHISTHVTIRLINAHLTIQLINAHLTIRLISTYLTIRYHQAH